ncbi:MAG: hypothetical protein ACHQHK_10450, partial [Dongiales bacterium]
MSDKPRLRPYEAEADAVRLSLLPGDGPPEDAAAKAPPPREYSLEDISLLDDGSELPVPLALSRKPSGFWSTGTAFAFAFALFAIGFLAYESLRAVLDAFSWWAPSGVLLALLLAGVVVT